MELLLLEILIQLKEVQLSFPPPKTFINFVDIAALCKAGMIKIFALPTIFEKGYIS